MLSNLEYGYRYMKWKVVSKICNISETDQCGCDRMTEKQWIEIQIQYKHKNFTIEKWEVNLRVTYLIWIKGLVGLIWGLLI